MNEKSALDKYIYESGLTKENVIKRSRINRTTFYTGLKYPVIFTDVQRKRIAKALRIELTELEVLIAK